jgi:antitoxin VapB
MWYITSMSDELHIDDPKAAELARELSKRTGETVSDAVTHALEERLQRNPARRRETEAEREERRKRILEIVAEMHKAPILDPRTAEELIGYDEDGLPS